MTFKLRFTWKIWILAAMAAVISGCDSNGEKTVQTAPAAPAANQRTIVAVGNSLTEGLGVDAENAYPEILVRKLAAAGHDWRVVNAGISGETSSGALSRIDWILTLAPDIVILETGANDGLRGVDTSLTEKNIDTIVRRLRERDVTVILAGMKMVANLGATYTSAFADIFPTVARKHGIALIPFFLEGVAGERSLNLSDGIHPNSDGYHVVADTVYPYVVAAIEGLNKD